MSLVLGPVLVGQAVVVGLGAWLLYRRIWPLVEAERQGQQMTAAGASNAPNIHPRIADAQRAAQAALNAPHTRHRLLGERNQRLSELINRGVV